MLTASSWPAPLLQPGEQPGDGHPREHLSVRCHPPWHRVVAHRSQLCPAALGMQEPPGGMLSPSLSEAAQKHSEICKTPLVKWE